MDPNFRDRFVYSMLPPNTTYGACVAALPKLFVGTLATIASLVNLVSSALQKEAAARVRLGPYLGCVGWPVHISELATMAFSLAARVLALQPKQLAFLGSSTASDTLPPYAFRATTCRRGAAPARS